MLKGNLSTRPFYNERLVGLVIVIAAIAGVALTVFNATTTMRLSGERQTQQAEQDRVDAEAEKSRTAATALQNSLNKSNLLMLADATAEANVLIEQRTFSWTAFFGIVEKTLPLDARLLSVAPRIERGVFMIVMSLNVKRTEDLEAFIDALNSTGAFYELLPGDMQRNEDGFLIATLSGGYRAPGVVPGRSKLAVRKGGPRP
ncbi:MAG TPA: hypothetical protein VN700_18700 [Vicinamibacterales bacterium]|nr:hypothetical protein [Vicinamibacterales bacterium]